MIFVVLFSVFTVALGIDPTVTISNTSPATKRNALGREEIVVLKNKDASLTCTVINREAGRKVQWIALRPDKPSQVISIALAQDADDPYKHQIDQPSTMSWRLRIQNVQVSDEMKYVCQVSIGNQKFASDERWLRVTESPRIIDLQTSSDMTVNEGDPVVLSCNASGRPTPALKWQRLAGGVLPNGGREHRQHVLNMGRATPDHRGHYKCSAQNEQGKDERKIQINVRFAPRISAFEPVAMQAVGYRKDLLCIIAGYPVPIESAVSWSRSGKPVTGSNYIIKYVESANSRVMSKLTIKNVQTADFGYYTCAATNSEDQGNPGTAEIELKQATEPTPDLTGRIRSGASIVTVSVTTIVMMLSICLLHYIKL